jgi:hypothetical protein
VGTCYGWTDTILNSSFDFSFHPVAEQSEEQDESEARKDKHAEKEIKVKRQFVVILPVRARETWV